MAQHTEIHTYSVLNVNEIIYIVNSFQENYENQMNIMAFYRKLNIVVLLCKNIV